MYILYKTERRAETTDTILFFAAQDYTILEEILLSLFDELYEKELKWAEKEEEDNYHGILKWCIKRMKCYQIINIPYIEN